MAKKYSVVLEVILHRIVRSSVSRLAICLCSILLFRLGQGWVSASGDADGTNERQKRRSLPAASFIRYAEAAEQASHRAPHGWLDWAHTPDHDEGIELSGWACDLDRPEQVLSVQFYHQQTFLGSIVANVRAGADVDGACGGHSTHRFTVDLDSQDPAMRALRCRINAQLKQLKTMQISAYAADIDHRGHETGSRHRLHGTHAITITPGGRRSSNEPDCSSL